MDFNDSWDDITLDDVVEEPDTQIEAAETTEADQPAEVETEKQTEAEQSAAGADSFLHVKHLDEERDLTREEATTFAQKGMDYDRVREKLDAANQELTQLQGMKAEAESLRETLGFLDELAKASGMTRDEMILDTRASLMAKQTGRDKETCKEIINLQDSNKKLMQGTPKTVDSNKERMDADIKDFMSEYPDISDFSTIPKEVWAEVSKGSPLVKAYAKWEKAQLLDQIEKLKAQAESEKQKSENKARSTGSQATESNKEHDPFDDLWYDGR